MDTMQTIMQAKKEKLKELLDEWLADESGYDESVWPRLKAAIEENRMSERKRFDDETRDVGHGTTGQDRSS